MKILVLGDRGMLGHVVKRYFENKNYNVVGLNRSHFDFRDLDKLRNSITSIHPEYVINCAGILVNGNDIQEFADVNIVIPRFLSYLSKKLGFKLIHISTNCVFKDKGPHDEKDTPNANDLYGMSKMFSEIIDDYNLTIRTSITGPEIKMKSGYSGLMHSFITNKNFNKGYTNIMWNGVTTLELAKFIENIIDKEVGLINYYTKNEASKYNIISIMNKVFNINRKIEPITNEKAHQSLLSGPHFTTKTFEDQFLELKHWMRKNFDLYEKIYTKNIIL